MDTTPPSKPTNDPVVPDFNDGREWELAEVRVYHRLPGGSTINETLITSPLDDDSGQKIDDLEKMEDWTKTEYIYQPAGERSNETMTGIDRYSPGLRSHEKSLIFLDENGQRKAAFLFYENEAGQWVTKQEY